MFVKKQSKNIACLLDVKKIKQVNNHHLPEKNQVNKNHYIQQRNKKKCISEKYLFRITMLVRRIAINIKN